MADKTGIEWTDATWNPLAGCSIVSPACTNCYAMAQAARIERMGGPAHYIGLTQPSKAGPVWTGKVALAPEHVLTKPLHWKRPRRIFVNSMSDLFHGRVPDEWIDRIFAVMALAPQHTFQILTKRAKRMREYLATPDRGVAWAIAADPTRDDAIISRSDYYRLAHQQESVPTAQVYENRSVFTPWPLPNVWLGVTAEDQTRADERCDDLVETPAIRRFVSIEPMLGPVDLDHFFRAGSHRHVDPIGKNPLHWVICGGESGPNARPMSIQWARELRDQCAAAGVPYFFKQWGEWAPARVIPSGEQGKFAFGDYEFDRTTWHFTDHYPRQFDKFGSRCVMERVGKRRAGSLLDGSEHKEFPQ
jgi:protein gp37